RPSQISRLKRGRRRRCGFMDSDGSASGSGADCAERFACFDFGGGGNDGKGGRRNPRVLRRSPLNAEAGARRNGGSAAAGPPSTIGETPNLSTEVFRITLIVAAIPTVCVRAVRRLSARSSKV